MAVSKSGSSATQLTASGTGAALNLSAAYSSTLYVRHSNGTGGSGFTGGSAIVQVKRTSGTYTNLMALSFSTTAGVSDHRVIPLPDDAANVQLVYTAPSGGTPPAGFTLDYEVGTVTG